MQKGHSHLTFMLNDERIWALHDAFDEMLEREFRTRDLVNALAPATPPIDVSPPNQHESKQAFLREKRTVEAALEHTEGLWSIFVQAGEADAETREMLASLGEFVDSHTKKHSKDIEDPSAIEVVRGSARMAGVHTSFLFLLLDLILALQERQRELKDQENLFWTVKNRPPNYHARAIAVRTARIYAREKGERPKFGTQRDGGAPSTSFARALEKIFEILEIKAGVRGPAEWAISELTDNDLQPAQNYLSGGLLGVATSRVSPNSMSKIANALSFVPGERSET